ncbi:hypothetical protein [Cryobacterium sp. TMT2-42-4]|uniref:hypothetical protein n=1 Tax=Cryobacterium sp. TMT2-42-4 TaxID=1259255 RepID=UPI001068F910|nr:hypothetical protein [Cryobacterium sp. TMT2-42-4]TFC37670.1 hypothetical protein E3O18_05050 [Cryobacterium sp. TMT2-42-4]
MAPWFKVDDGLSSKVQTTRIPRAHRRAALGLWALAGSWSAKELTDGHIPEHMLDELTGTPDDAAWLVKADYWMVVEDGWQFVEWAPEQPLREVVLRRRQKDAEKSSTWRSRNRPSNPVTPPVANPVSHAPVTLPPSRPNPTSASNEAVHLLPPAEHLNALESEFADWWEICWRKQSKAEAFKAFRVARKDTDLATLLAGARAYKLLNIEQDKALTKLPGGWLRDRRWEDEDQIAYTRSDSGDRQSKAQRTMMAAEMDGSLNQRRGAMPPRQHEITGMCPLHAEYPDPCDLCRRIADEELPDRVL